MPPKSQRQARFMRAVAGGKAKNKPAGLSRQEADEFVSGRPTRGLPEQAEHMMDEMPPKGMPHRTPPPPKAPPRRKQ